MKTKIEQILNFDPIHEVEKLSGKYPSNFDENDMKDVFALNYLHGQNKKELFKSNNDTYFSMDWKEFNNLLSTNGFEKGLSYTFQKYDNQPETATLFYHEKGLILWATSYNNSSVNCAKIYGQVSYNGLIEWTKKVDYWDTNKKHKVLTWTDKLEKAYDALNGFSHDAFVNIDKGLHISLDCREGLFYHLSKIEEYFSFNPTWTKRPFLWFLDYSEEAQKDYDHKQITQDKINKASIEIKNIIGID